MSIAKRASDEISGVFQKRSRERLFTSVISKNVRRVISVKVSVYEHDDGQVEYNQS